MHGLWVYGFVPVVYLFAWECRNLHTLPNNLEVKFVSLSVNSFVGIPFFVTDSLKKILATVSASASGIASQPKNLDRSSFKVKMYFFLWWCLAEGSSYTCIY